MTKVLCSTINQTREEWLDCRKQGIGGSDIGTICGMNQYQSAFALWLEKTGQAQSDNIDNEAMLWGRLHEETVAKEFASRTGFKVSKRNAILQHDDFPWALANIDRYCTDEKGIRGVLEVKTTGMTNKAAWEGDSVPEVYLLQLMWYLGVTGAQYGYLACLIGGNKLEIRKVARDEELIAGLFARGAEFWRCVETLTPPDVDGTEATKDAISDLFPAAVGEDEVELPADALRFIAHLEDAKKKAKAAEEEVTEWENHLKLLLGDKPRGRVADRVVSWTNVTSERLDSKKLKAEHPDLYSEYSKPSAYRRFNVK